MKWSFILGGALALMGCSDAPASAGGSTGAMGGFDTTGGQTSVGSAGSSSSDASSEGGVTVSSTASTSSSGSSGEPSTTGSTGLSGSTTEAAETSSDGTAGTDSSGEPVVCGDGRPDVDGVCLGEGTSFDAGTTPVDVVAGDFDGDGQLDLVTAHPAGDLINLMLGDGAGGFAAPVPTSLAVDAEPVALAAGMLTDDAVIDVLVANAGNATVSILAGGPEGFTVTSLPTGGSPSDVAIADLNGSGRLDFAVVNAEDDVFSTWTALDAGGYLLTDVNDGGPIPYVDVFVLGEVAIAGPIDVVFAGDLVVGASPGAGDGSIEETVEIVADVVAPIRRMGGGDVDGDGELDVVLATEAGVVMLVGDGNPNAAQFDESLLGIHDHVVDAALVDVTGEGHQDVVAIARGDAELVVYPGLGDGTFGEAVTYPIDEGASALVTADLDGDGDKEVVVVSDGTDMLTVFSPDP